MRFRSRGRRFGRRPVRSRRRGSIRRRGVRALRIGYRMQLICFAKNPLCTARFHVPAVNVWDAVLTGSGHGLTV